MRLLALISVLAFGVTGLAQTENPYLRIESSLAQTQREPNLTIEATGWQNTGRDTLHFSLRLFASQGKVYAEQFVDNRKRLVIVADGAKVWRYDPVLNEYTFLTQPEDLTKTVSLVTAWSRVHLQRPLRALAGSVRWLVRPQFEEGDDFVRMFQIRLVQGDWRGTDSRFTFDDRGRMEGITIEDRLDVTQGFQHSWLEAVFAYPETLNMSFTFTPPTGAKPAADLPVRISGDGG